MSVYSVEIKLCATLYVRADSEEAAIAMATALDGQDSPPVCTESFDSARLPDATISPEMTCYGLFDPSAPVVDLVHDPVSAATDPA